MHPADFYHDQRFVGGVFRWENRIGWSTTTMKNIAPQHPGNPSEPNYEMKRSVYERRYAQAYDRILAGKNAQNLDWLTEMYQHKTYDEFWKARSYGSRHAELDIPVFHGGVWYDHFIRGTLTAHAEVDVPKRLIIGPGWWALRKKPATAISAACRSDWSRLTTSAEENGVLEGPAARLYRFGDEAWIDESEWPVPAVETSFYLAPGPGGGPDSPGGGLLLRELPACAEMTLVHDPSDPNATPHLPDDQRSFGAKALVFSTPPLDEDVEVIGTMKLVLSVSSDAPDVDFCVRLCDVYEDGRAAALEFRRAEGKSPEFTRVARATDAGEGV